MHICGMRQFYASIQYLENITLYLVRADAIIKTVHVAEQTALCS